VGVIPGDTLGQVLPWNIHLGVDFSKGKAVTDWLQGVFPTMTKGVVGEFSPVWKSITSIDGTKAQVWGIGPLPTPQPRIFSVNTPAGVPLTAQCGKGVHIDAHVNRVQGTEGIGFTFPADPYCTAPMKPTDAMFTFFLFDSASCIQRDRDTPVSPPTK
jgi:hypothetical protein